MDRGVNAGPRATRGTLNAEVDQDRMTGQIRGMRFLLALLVVTSVAIAAAPSRDQRLEEYKKQFPQHSAGPVTERSHPVIKSLWDQYQLEIDRIQPHTIARDLVRLAEKIEHDIHEADRGAEDVDNVFGSEGRHAARHNAIWLRNRVKPYIKRMAQLSRGS